MLLQFQSYLIPASEGLDLFPNFRLHPDLLLLQGPDQRPTERPLDYPGSNLLPATSPLLQVGYSKRFHFPKPLDLDWRQ